MTSSYDPSSPAGSSYPGTEPYPTQPGSAVQPYPTVSETYNAAGAGGYQQASYSQPGYQQASYSQPGYQQAYTPMYVGAPQKSKIAAGCLGIFLGVFGIHNFYLGYTGKAVAQLLLTILSFGILAFVSSIWGLIEGILILTATPGTVPWGVDAQGVPLQS